MVVEDGEVGPYLHWLAQQGGEQWYAVTYIKTLPFNTSYAAAIKAKLQQHGCRIEEYQDYYVLIFPPETRKKLTGPVTMVEAYTIRFQDGYEMRQEYDRGRGISRVAVPG